MFLNDRQHLPTESRRRIGKWSRGLERVYEDVLKEGVRRGEFRSDLDTRLTVLAMLGMANAAAFWYSKEEISLDRIAAEFSRLLLEGREPSGQPHAGAVGDNVAVMALGILLSYRNLRGRRSTGVT